MAITRFYIREDLNKSFETLPKVLGYKDGDITREEFDNLVSIDPTYRAGSENPGKYIKWLLRTYKTNKKIIDEDADKVKEYLKTYANMVRTNSFEDNRDKDIMSIKSVDRLFEIVEPHMGSDLKSNKEKKSELKGNIDKIYEDDTWVALIPKDKEASCSYGSGTQWCTASASNNYFDRYNNQGPLIIVINKKEKDSTGRAKKWQFHHESDSYMDAKDVSIDLYDWRKENDVPKGLLKAIAEV